jgi:NAD(P)-dependent dehydrogenase (short-subunit alcohol dehydrogenase family)
LISGASVAGLYVLTSGSTDGIGWAFAPAFISYGASATVINFKPSVPKLSTAGVEFEKNRRSNRIVGA